MTSSSDSFKLVYLHCSIWPPLLMQHFYPTLAFKPLIPLPPNLYLLPLQRLLLLAVSQPLLLPLPSTDSLRLLQWNAGDLRAWSTELYIIFCLIPLTLFVSSRNPILIHLPLYRSLDSLLYDLIALTLDLAFFLLMPCTLAAASSFSSDRAYPSLIFLPPLSLRLIPTLDYVGVNISLNNTSSRSFLNVYAPPICSSLTVSRTDSFFSCIFSSSRYLLILVDFDCHHPLWNSKGTPYPHGEKVLDWVISFDLLSLNDFDIPTLLRYLICSLFSRPILVLRGTSGPGL